MAAKKTPAQKTWTPEALAALANAWLAANPANQPTPEMLASPALTYAGAVPEAPPTVPFLTPEQQGELNKLFMDTGNQLSVLDQADNDALVAAMQQIGDPTKFDPNDTGADLTQAVNKQAMVAKVNATDAAIARGLFQSSMRDADLADIEATRQMRRNFFRDQYLSVTKANATQRKNIQDFVKTAVGTGYDPNDPNSKLGGTYGSAAIENAKNAPGSPGKTGTFSPVAPAKINPLAAPQQATGKVKAPKTTPYVSPATQPGWGVEANTAMGVVRPRRRRRRG